MSDVMKMFKYTKCTENELKFIYSTDKYIENDSVFIYRAISIDTSPDNVFKWITQLRFAPYSYDWIDNGGRKSPPNIIPNVPHLKRGDAIMRIFKLTEYKKNEFITFTLPKDAPTYLRMILKLFAKSFYITYQLFLSNGNKTRLVVKILINPYQGFFHKFMVKFADVVDYIMMRKQLLNFKKLAEG